MESALNVDNAALYALVRSGSTKWAALRNELALGLPPASVLRDSLGAHLITDEFDDAIRAAQSEIDEFERAGIHVDTAASHRYPAQLLTVHDHPPVIYWMGHQDQLDLRSVAIVGTREPSEGAVRFVSDLARMLAASSVPVVSGLARGVDSAAMQASLDAGNRTIGVIGTGVRKFYPRENRHLQEKIASEHLLISQFHPDSGAGKHTFPMRNVVMSAYSSLTVIAEAAEHSGTRIQANAAVRHGRPLIISRAVYLRTSWGRKLSDGGYDVQVVGTAEEALAAVLRVHSRYRDRSSRWTTES